MENNNWKLFISDQQIKNKQPSASNHSNMFIFTLHKIRARISGVSVSRYLFFLLVILKIHSYAGQPEFRYIQGKDGLNDSEVNSITQDKDGIMWFATYSGLISYDGYNFKHYRTQLGNPNGLPDKKIRLLFIDSENNLWLASRKHLCRYIKATDSFITYRFQNFPPTGLFIINVSQIGNNIIAHVVDEYDNIQDGYYIMPLKYKDNPDYHWKRCDALYQGKMESNYFSYITKLNDTSIIMVSNNENTATSNLYTAALLLAPEDTTIQLTKLIELNAVTNHIEYVQKEKSLYIGSSRGMYVYSLDNKSLGDKALFPNEAIMKVVYASNNTIYFASESPGLFYIKLYSGKSGIYTANPNKTGTLLNNRINAMFEDFSGNLWIGHQGLGISILNLHQKGFYTHRYDPLNKKSLQKNAVTCFATTSEEVFIGLRPGGINYTKKNLRKSDMAEFKEIKMIEDGKIISFKDVVWDIEKASNDIFWVASNSGLYRMTKNQGNWFLEKYRNAPLFNQLIREIFIDPYNNVWFGVHSQGLILLPNPEKNSDKVFYQYKTNISNSETLSDNTILSMKIDSKDRFWIGTENGLNLLINKYNSLNLSGNVQPNLSLKRYIATSENDKHLNNNEINCIFENFDGSIWIGTQGGGINILDPTTDHFTHITVDEGLPSNDVKGILSDEMGKIWISTTKGLAAYNQHLKNPSFYYYDASDGLQGNLFFMNAYYKSGDGEMFFGGDNGFTRFYPENISPNDIKPKIAFTDLNLLYNPVEIGDTILGHQILQKHINETGKITLPFKHKTFSISVAAIHYQNPDGNRIIYMLEGYDTNWKTIPASFRNIYYSNLPSGTYKLKVKAVNSDNIISDNSKTLTIEILKPWYFRWYSIVIFGLITLSVAGSIVYIIFNRQKLIYEKEIDKLAIENTESKMAFLTNIAHGLKTPLSLVVAPIDDLVHNYSDIQPEWKNHLHFIQRNANYLVKLINQIIDFRKLNAGKLKLYKQQTDIVNMVKDVAMNFYSFQNSQQVKLNMDIPYQSIFISVDSQKIEEVLYNLISNAFKYTPKNHEIEISIRLLKNQGQRITKDDDNILKISIYNEGPTIHPKEKDKIFERFYKVNDHMEGAGIGLSFSQSLVEMHGGAIEVESVEDKGMAFHILLPNKDNESTTIVEEYNNHLYKNPGSIIPDEVQSNNMAHHGDDSRLKIVLVEDNTDLRRFLQNVLTKNYTCYEANNGEEGWKIIHQTIPDIVISDIVMPEKNGYDLCREIKNNNNTCHIPVILLTAKNSQEQIISGYDVGADAYVTKPFDIKIITSQISRLIKNRELIRKKYNNQNFMVEVTPNTMTKDDEFILNFRNFLDQNISDPGFNVKVLGEMMEVSPAQLYRKIKALTGYSPVEFIRLLKLQKAYELIMERKHSVKEVCYMAGFNNKSYFIKCFKEKFGITPASLKESGAISNS